MVETFKFFLARRPTFKRLKRLEAERESLAAHGALRGIEEEQAFRETEDPREQAALRASMFARGLGKSTIASQEQARLTAIQQRRRAHLARQQEIAQKGIHILRARRKMAKRMVLPQFFAALQADAAAIAGAMAGAPTPTAPRPGPESV